MRFVLVGVLLLGACNGDPTRYPVNPGGGGGPPGLNGGGVRDPGDDGGDDDDPPVDAPTTPGDGALPATFAGRACLITDLRRPRANCDGTDAGMIDVRLVGANRSTDSTAMDGTFTIGGQATPIRYVLSRVDHIETLARFDNPTNQIMPFMTIVGYNTLLTANGVSAGGGGLVLEILDGANQPIVGATVALVGFVTFYDANDPLVFSQVSTGPRGVAWLPQVPGGDVTVLVNPNNGKQPKNVTLTSFDSATITHELVVFP